MIEDAHNATDAGFHVPYSAPLSPRACMYEAIEFFWGECDKYFANVVLRDGKNSLVNHMADFVERYARAAGDEFEMPGLVDSLIEELAKRQKDKEND